MPKGFEWLPKSLLEVSQDAKLNRLRFGKPRGRLKGVVWGTI